VECGSGKVEMEIAITCNTLLVKCRSKGLPMDCKKEGGKI
jgi:hypothetical protein